MYLTLLGRDAIDDNAPNPRGQSLANLSIVFACLSFCFVCARVSTRYWIRKALGPDDYLIMVAVVLAAMMAVSYNGEVNNGFGLHKSQISKKHLIEAMKWFFVAQLLYKIAICLTKLSILFFYMRIFVTRNFQRAAWTVACITVAYSLGSIGATIWQCNPIPRTWDKSIHGKCIQIGDVWYSTSIMAIITDVAIIVLPIYQIRRLQLPLSQRLALCFMFSLGFFVIACTVVRMIVVGPAVAAVDTPYYQATSNSWTFLEVNVAIICACLPDIRGLATRFIPCLGHKPSRDVSQYAATGDGSRSSYNPKNHFWSRPTPPATNDDASGEEFVLNETNGVTKTTVVSVSYGV